MEEQFKKLKDKVDGCEGCNGILGSKLDKIQETVEKNNDELIEISRRQMTVIQHLAILVEKPII